MSPILTNDIVRWFLKIIDTCYFDDDYSDCLCFPFGCYLCHCCKLCFSKNRKKTNKFNNLQNIELPEIIGFIKPIIIANEKKDSTNKIFIIIIQNNNKYYM